jgi:hypothetical protein
LLYQRGCLTLLPWRAQRCLAARRPEGGVAGGCCFAGVCPSPLLAPSGPHRRPAADCRGRALAGRSSLAVAAPSSARPPTPCPRRPPQTPSSPQASDRGCGLQAEALVGLIFGHLLPSLDIGGLVDLLDFMQNT